MQGPRRRFGSEDDIGFGDAVVAVVLPDEVVCCIRRKTRLSVLMTIDRVSSSSGLNTHNKSTKWLRRKKIGNEHDAP